MFGVDIPFVRECCCTDRRSPFWCSKKMAEVKNSSLGGNPRTPIGSCFSGEKTKVIVDFCKFIGSEKNLQASGKIKHKNLRCS